MLSLELRQLAHVYSAVAINADGGVQATAREGTACGGAV